MNNVAGLFRIKPQTFQSGAPRYSLPAHSVVRSFALWVGRELLKGFVQFVTEVVGRSLQMAIGARAELTRGIYLLRTFP